jgi:hypothetical protein
MVLVCDFRSHRSTAALEAKGAVNVLGNAFDFVGVI